MSIPSWFYKEHKEQEVSAGHETKSAAVEGVRKIRELISSGTNETGVQDLLKQYPEILGGMYRNGHGTWAFPELSFPKEYRADWLTASGSSGGLMWELIELEDPMEVPFKQNGHFAKSVRKGIEQIKDWREYIQSNLEIVSKPKSKHGFGLHELRPRTMGIVVVGIRDKYSDEESKSKYDENRRRTEEDERIKVISYDSFLERCLFQFTRPPLG